MTRRRLRMMRKRLGLSVAQAASLVHVSRRTWTRWESGETRIPETASHLFSVLATDIAPLVNVMKVLTRPPR